MYWVVVVGLPIRPFTANSKFRRTVSALVVFFLN